MNGRAAAAAAPKIGVNQEQKEKALRPLAAAMAASVCVSDLRRARALSHPSSERLHPFALPVSAAVRAACAAATGVEVASRRSAAVAWASRPGAAAALL